MSDVNPTNTSSNSSGNHCVRPSDKKHRQNKNIPSHVKYAKKLHQTASIYAWYGLLDGLSLSYSMVKYGFDVLYENSKSSSSDAMHDWMVSPVGVAAAGAEAITLITMSFIANTCSDNDPNAIKRYIALTWPYLRDALKGLKNGFKGVRSALAALGQLSGQNIKHLFVPMGLITGICVALNRLWYRNMREQRKDMMKQNEKIHQNIKKNMGWAGENCEVVVAEEPPDPKDILSCPIKGRAAYIIHQNHIYYVNKNLGTCVSIEKPFHEVQNIKSFLQIQNKSKTLDQAALYFIEKQTGFAHLSVQDIMAKQQNFMDKNRIKALASQLFSGFVDGLYLYMGVLSISTIAPQFFVLASVLSIFYAISCLITRVHEEHVFQHKLSQSQTQVELAVSAKELEMACLELLAELAGLEKLDGVCRQENLDDIAKKFEEQYLTFIEKRRHFVSQTTVSMTSAAITGLQNGLSAYGVLVGTLFAFATVMGLCGLGVAPMLVIGTVLAGLVCVIGLTAYTMVKNYYHQKAQQKLHEEDPERIFNVRKKLHQAKTQNNISMDELPCEKEVQLAILDGMTVDPSYQFFFQEIFEIFRSVFSGVAKGYKAIVHIFNAMLEEGDDGHYKESSVMLWLTILSAGLFSVVLGLRALARGFGRLNTEDQKEATADVRKKDPPPSPFDMETTTNSVQTSFEKPTDIDISQESNEQDEVSMNENSYQPIEKDQADCAPNATHKQKSEPHKSSLKLPRLPGKSKQVVDFVVFGQSSPVCPTERDTDGLNASSLSSYGFFSRKPFQKLSLDSLDDSLLTDELESPRQALE